MKLITEQIEDVQILEESTKDGKKNLYIEGTFLQGNLKNRNGRYYPINTLEREVNKYNESFVKSGRALGELGHPDGPTVNLDRVSHLITSLVREDTNFKGKARILDTPMGNIAKNLLGEGVTLGVSSRGIGSLKEQDGCKMVADDFILATAADIVADPSAPDAFVNGIIIHYYRFFFTEFLTFLELPEFWPNIPGISEISGISYEEMAKHTYYNTTELFRLP